MIVVGRDAERLAATERVLDKWASTPQESVTMAHEAAAEMAAIKKAIATGDPAALETYGGLNPALQRTLNPQRRPRRKPPVRGRDHDGSDVAVDARAV